MSAASASRSCAPAYMPAGVSRNGRPPAQSRPSAVVLQMPASAARTPKFEHAILPHLDAAFNLARWLTHDAAEAEEVVQDACLKALQYFPSFRGGSGKAWLLRIVRNTAYSRLSARKTAIEVALGSVGTETHDGGIGMNIADPAPGPEAALAAAQELAQLNAAIAALPPKLRECLILREIEELSYREIAQVADISIGTVMSRLFRARQRLTLSYRNDARTPAGS